MNLDNNLYILVENLVDEINSNQLELNQYKEGLLKLPNFNFSYAVQINERENYIKGLRFTLSKLAVALEKSSRWKWNLGFQLEENGIITKL